MLACRSSVHDSTAGTPNLLMFGREVEFAIHMLYGRNDAPKPFVTPLISLPRMCKLQCTLYDGHELARAQILKAGANQKKRYGNTQNKPYTKLKI